MFGDKAGSLLCLGLSLLNGANISIYIRSAKMLSLVSETILVSLFNYSYFLLAVYTEYKSLPQWGNKTTDTKVFCLEQRKAG